MPNKNTTLPTVPQATQFQGMFDYLNEHLFNNELHSCMLVFSRNANVIGGYFSPDKWVNEETDTTVHEIGLNANVIKDQHFIDMVDTVVHEMIHLYQHLNGTSSRRGYHNKDFVKRAEALGFEVIGKGQAVDTKVKVGGLVETVALDMPEELIFAWTANALNVPDPSSKEARAEAYAEANAPRSKSGKRTTYQCPICGCKAWGKAGMALICGEDDMSMVESN